MLALMAVAAVADVVTFLSLPPGAESNPFIAAIGPVFAVMAKLVVVLALIAVWERLRGRLRTLVYGFATVAWSFGAIVNVLSWR